METRQIAYSVKVEEYKTNCVSGTRAKTLMLFRVIFIIYATSRKVAGSSPDEVDFVSIYLILPAALWP
jgi:hypothetical protein